MRSRFRSLVVTSLVAVHVLTLVINVAVLYLVHFPGYAEDEFLGWYCAVPLAQASAWAIWNCWGPRRLVLRSWLAAWIIPLAAIAVIWLVPNYYLASRTIRLLWLIYGLHLVVMHGALCICRAVTGWRLVGAPRSSDQEEPKFVEFSGRGFLLWTLLLIALYFVARWLVEHSLEPLPRWPRAASVPILLGGNLVMLALAFWAALERDSGLLWLAFAGLLAMVLTAGQIVLNQAFRTQMLISEVFVWSWNGWQFALVLGTLMAIRACGYRLERRSRPSA